MNVIVFSKDRPAQLDLLLRSMPYKLLSDTVVLFKHSTLRFSSAYTTLIEDYRSKIIGFVGEEDFKTDIICIIDDEDPFTMFLTDDDVFINPDFKFWELGCMVDDIACISLRLNPNLPYCYTLNRRQWPPKDLKFNTWDWRNADADYGYPMSLDGHIFRTSDIMPLLKRLQYNNPNELEGQLARHPINRPYMICYDKSIIVNNPINRVQDTVKNRHGNITAEYLNEQFLAGKRIKLEPFIGYKNRACHEEIPIEWE